jgi:hypothetical protein
LRLRIARDHQLYFGKARFGDRVHRFFELESPKGPS